MQLCFPPSTVAVPSASQAFSRSVSPRSVATILRLSLVLAACILVKLPVAVFSLRRSSSAVPAIFVARVDRFLLLCVSLRRCRSSFFRRFNRSSVIPVAILRFWCGCPVLCLPPFSVVAPSATQVVCLSLRSDSSHLFVARIDRAVFPSEDVAAPSAAQVFSRRVSSPSVAPILRLSLVCNPHFSDAASCRVSLRRSSSAASAICLSPGLTEFC